VQTGIFTAADDTVAQWGWRPDAPSTAEEALTHRSYVVGRAHHEWQNNAIARALINRLVETAVGTNLRVQCQPKYKLLGIDEKKAQEWATKVEALFMADWESARIDQSGMRDGTALCSVLLTNVLVHGDSGVRFIRKKKDGLPTLKLQIIDSLRFDTPVEKAAAPDVIAGVEVDPGTGEPSAYYIKVSKPNAVVDTKSFNKYLRFPRYEHGRLATSLVFLPTRPDQYRGYSVLLPSIESLKMLSDLENAVVRAEQNRSSVAFAIKAADPETPRKELDGNLVLEGKPSAAEYYGKGGVVLAAGKVLTMRPGDELVTLQNTNNVAVLKDISDLLTMTIGASCSMPQGMLLQKRLGSYSAARGDELDADAHARHLLWNLKNWLCRPFFESWLEIKVAAGEIDAPGFFLDPMARSAWTAHEWQGPTRGHIDPVKMATFVKICKRMGLCSNERAMAILFGADVSDEVQRMASETELYTEAGLKALLTHVQLEAEQAKAKGALRDHDHEGADESEADEANDE
jgi:lambda family phage portal protein